MTFLAFERSLSRWKKTFTKILRPDSKAARNFDFETPCFPSFKFWPFLAFKRRLISAELQGWPQIRTKESDFRPPKFMIWNPMRRNISIPVSICVEFSEIPFISNFSSSISVQSIRSRRISPITLKIIILSINLRTPPLSLEKIVGNDFKDYFLSINLRVPPLPLEKTARRVVYLESEQLR